MTKRLREESVQETAKAGKRTRLAQMLAYELNRRQLAQREAAREFGFSQQALNSWLTGSSPRESFFGRISNFLKIDEDMVRELAEEAKISTGNTRIPKIRTLERQEVYGEIRDPERGVYEFNFPFPKADRYAMEIGTDVMEPVLLFGRKIWVEPTVFPRVGNDVVVRRDNGDGHIGKLISMNNDGVGLKHYKTGREFTVGDIAAIHVIVLAERA